MERLRVNPDSEIAAIEVELKLIDDKNGRKEYVIDWSKERRVHKKDGSTEIIDEPPASLPPEYLRQGLQKGDKGV